MANKGIHRQAIWQCGTCSTNLLLCQVVWKLLSILEGGENWFDNTLKVWKCVIGTSQREQKEGTHVKRFIPLLFVLALVATACSQVAYTAVSWENGIVTRIERDSGHLVVVVDTESGERILDIASRGYERKTAGDVGEANTVGSLYVVLEKGTHIEFVTEWEQYGEPRHTCETGSYVLCKIDVTEIRVLSG